jgi:hypothetical protein
MKTIVVGALVVAVLVPATASANNRSVAASRMTRQLFAERRSEVSYKDGDDPASGLVFLEEVTTSEGSYRSWRPAKLGVSCWGDRCTGRLVVNDEEGETYVALEDHAAFRGRKGTYHEAGWEPPS